MNLLIVDDETTTRNGLMRHINWAALGIQKIELASGGAEALERCSVFAPDIVLSDIRMPEMDGIRMCRLLREQYPECAILFLSGYSDKEYLHSAIDLGAVDYIEKPIDLEELETAVKKAAAQVLRSRLHNRSMGNIHQMISRNMPVIRQKTAESLITPNVPQEQYKADLELLNVFSDFSCWFTVLLIQYSQPVRDVQSCEQALLSCLHPFLESFEYLYAFKDARRQILILSAPVPKVLPHSGHEKELSALISSYAVDGMSAFCAVGQAVHGIQSVSDSFANAVIALQKLFYRDYGQTACYVEEKNAPLSLDPMLLEDFFRSLLQPEPDNAISILDTIYHKLKIQQTVLPSHIRPVYQKIDYLIAERKRQMNPSWNPPGTSTPAQSDVATLKELHSYYKEQLESLFTSMEADNGKRTIIQVQLYVQSHYSDSLLSVKEISKAVYLTPNYLSNVFKREMGCSLVEYIRDVRIKNSLPLLSDNSFKLYHIALKVGFTDANYYAKMFKKTMGLTPSEYKERHL